MVVFLKMKFVKNNQSVKLVYKTGNSGTIELSPEIFVLPGRFMTYLGRFMQKMVLGKILEYNQNK